MTVKLQKGWEGGRTRDSSQPGSGLGDCTLALVLNFLCWAKTSSGEFFPSQLTHQRTTGCQIPTGCPMFLVKTSKSIYVHCSRAHVLIYRYKICSFDHLQSNCTFVRRLSLCALDFFLWLVWVVGVTGQKAIQVIWDLYGHATFLLGRTLMHSRHTEEMVAASSSIFFKTFKRCIGYYK